MDRSFYRFVTIHACDRRTDGQTDRQTDGQTDRILIARPRLHCMQRGKNQNRKDIAKLNIWKFAYEFNNCKLNCVLRKNKSVSCLPPPPPSRRLIDRTKIHYLANLQQNLTFEDRAIFLITEYENSSYGQRSTSNVSKI